MDRLSRRVAADWRGAYRSVRVIRSRGRNRIFEDHAVGGVISGTRLAHAELNALVTVADCHNLDRATCVLYTTTEPCALCIGAARMWGIREIRYLQRDAVAGSVDLAHATPFMARARINSEWFGDRRIESLQMAMLMERHLDVAPLAGDLATLWADANPAGVALARELSRVGLAEASRRGGSGRESCLVALGWASKRLTPSRLKAA